MRDFKDGDLPPFPIKQLPGVVLDSRKWAIVPNGKYLLEPKRFETQPGSPGRRPMGVHESEIVLPSRYAGISVSWYCNANYDKETGEIVFAYNSKLAKTARRLFPEESNIIDPPAGCLLEHYLIGEIVLADKGREGGKIVEKPKERHYSKVDQILAVGPRFQTKHSKAPTIDLLESFFNKYLEAGS